VAKKNGYFPSQELAMHNALFHQPYWLRKKLAFFATVPFSHTTTCFDCIAGVGVLTACYQYARIETMKLRQKIALYALIGILILLGAVFVLSRMPSPAAVPLPQLKSHIQTFQ
jgi:hypothetical protein